MRNISNISNDYSRRMFIEERTMDVVRDVAASLDFGYASRMEAVMRRLWMRGGDQRSEGLRSCVRFRVVVGE